MQAFMLYMSGGRVQIFSTGIITMLLLSPFKHVLTVNTGAFCVCAPCPIFYQWHQIPFHHTDILYGILQMYDNINRIHQLVLLFLAFTLAVCPLVYIFVARFTIALHPIPRTSTYTSTTLRIAPVADTAFSLQVLRFLSFKRRILHRDVSVGNMMYIENPEIPEQDEESHPPWRHTCARRR
jgi:hypothetical protein